MKILIIGANGMLGHVVKTFFQEKDYEVWATSRRNGSELYFNAEENINEIETIIKNISPNVVINCIGILNKDAEEHKKRAVLINSYLPHFLDSLSQQYGFKFIHISTDCVFEGTRGNYTEDDFPDATSFYGRSKALGEIKNDRNVTLRTSIVGPDINPNGIGLFKWFMEQENEVGGYSKVLWTGVTTIELAKNIEVAIKENLTGLQHVVNNKTIPKKELLELFKKYFKKEITINDNPNVESKKTLIRTDKSFDFKIPSYDEMISEMYEWVKNHSNLYSNLIIKKQKQ